jgi:hypothetical protein
MQFRRGLIAFALVLAGVTAIASISPPPDENDGPDLSAAPRPKAVAPETVQVGFRHPVEAAPPQRAVRNGSHVIVRVEAGIAGNVEISGLGLIEPVAPGTPAVFDVLANRTGRYDVNLLSVAGERTEVGALVVED